MLICLRDERVGGIEGCLDQLGLAETDCGFDSTAYDPEGDVLQLETMEGDLCARIERTDEGQCSLTNTSWRLDEIWVGPIVLYPYEPSRQVSRTARRFSCR